MSSSGDPFDELDSAWRALKKQAQAIGTNARDLRSKGGASDTEHADAVDLGRRQSIVAAGLLIKVLEGIDVASLSTSMSNYHRDPVDPSDVKVPDDDLQQDSHVLLESLREALRKIDDRRKKGGRELFGPEIDEHLGDWLRQADGSVPQDLQEPLDP